MNIEDYFITEDMTLLEAMGRLDEVPNKVLFVVSERKLKASITDGDIRRAILHGVKLNAAVSEIANYHPIAVHIDKQRECKKILIEKDIHAIPLINDSNEIVGIYQDTRDGKSVTCEDLNLPIVIMAGGLGTRLYPYTKILPKPLIPIEDTPISERIINSFETRGCKDFYMVVNHKKNMIKAYFNEISKKYSLRFIDENEPLGTGGGVRLLKGIISETFVLTNCDILILDDINKIVEHHKQSKNHVTMVCSLKNYQIPYGVVKFSEGGAIEGFEEKPRMSFFTNTGYYILEPIVFEYIKDNEHVGMPDVILRMKRDNLQVGIYPISESSWLDMGQMDTMENMERRVREFEKERLSNSML